jgi:chorismate mutase/prephenate dehydratase
MNPDEQLSKIRDRIDAIDSQLLELISERARCAQEVAQVKLNASQSDEAPPVFYRPEREAQVLRAIQERNPGPLASEHIASVFREIMSSCLALEQPLSVAFLGPEGTYSQAAALKHFGQSAVPQGQASIHKVFRQVEERLCDYGVVPVENSTEGMVGQTLDCFLESPLQITGEIELPVVHHLLAAQGAEQSDIQLILGHEQALGQCRLKRVSQRLPVSWQQACISLAFWQVPYRTALRTPHDFWCWVKRVCHPVAMTKRRFWSLRETGPVRYSDCCVPSRKTASV